MPTPRFEVRPFDPARARRRRLLLALAWLGSLLVVAAATALFVERRAVPHEGRAVADTADTEALKARIAILERSEQVAKAALADLQRTLRDREEEIAGVRTDLAFYGRLVGGQRREGLAIHALTLSPVAGSRAWNLRATLTQNFKRGAETKGRFVVSVTGVREGQLATLSWGELTQQSSDGGIAYAFKYFQQIDGTIMLPEGFEPNRVRATAEGDGGKAEQEFNWNDAAKAEETTDVRQ